MNYRTHSMDELVDALSNERDADRFIEGCKAFIQKFVDDDYVPRHTADEVLEREKDKAQESGYQEARDACREEAVRSLDENKNWLLHDGYQEDWNQMMMFSTINVSLLFFS